MAWNLPALPTAGTTVATVANWATKVIDSLRYLKGLDGVPTIESGLIIDNTDGDEYLKLPLLSTAECSTVLNAAGEIAYDEATNRIKMYGATLNSVVTTSDVDDTPVNGATTDPVSSNWAYDHLNLLTTAGDTPYATAAGVWARLGIGTSGQVLKTNSGATAPEWGTTAIFAYAEETLQFSNDSSVNTACTTSYVKRKEIQIGTFTANTIRIKFTMASADGGQTAYGRIYRNGAAIGTERSTTTSGTYSEDFDSSSWTTTDLIQIYGKGSAAAWQHVYSNFRLYYNVCTFTSNS